MPELPEVETTRRGIAPHLLGHAVSDVIVRDRRLRWPVPRNLRQRLHGQTFQRVERRAKYLLLHTDVGCVILHLGMSGSLHILPKATPPATHDHLDIVLAGGHCLRLRDPRRFGSLHWSTAPDRHFLLAHLGPEPWDAIFTGTYLHRRARRRTLAVKAFIMDAKTVVGVGNIYASEALFRAGIHPGRRAGRISEARYVALAQAIVSVLDTAIEHGGTTLRDFVGSDGRPGYFRHELQVYDRADAPCRQCGQPIRRLVLGQRASYYCKTCQR